jgi:hypothetical protein
MQQQQTLQRPFFAQFLEKQNKKEDGTQAGFPWPIITDKLRDHLEQTQKYPSDGDEI